MYSLEKMSHPYRDGDLRDRLPKPAVVWCLTIVEQYRGARGGNHLCKAGIPCEFASLDEKDSDHYEGSQQPAKRLLTPAVP